MDAARFEPQGALLLAHDRPSTARKVLETGALLGGAGPSYGTRLADCLRRELRHAERLHVSAPPGAGAADVLLWYAEAMRRGGLSGQALREGTVLAANWWDDAGAIGWHERMLEAGADPTTLWSVTALAAAASGATEVAQYGLDQLRQVSPGAPLIPAMAMMIAQGLSEGTVASLDDGALKHLVVACDEQGLVEGLAVVATALLTRQPGDAATREAYAAALEGALLGTPGAPDLGTFHPTGAGRALLAMAEAMADDPDGRWMRRRAFARLRGGELPETVWSQLREHGVDPGALPDAFLHAAADSFLYRSQRFQPARFLLDYAVARDWLDDPRAWRMHAWLTFLQGERLHGWASLLAARRTDRAPVQLGEASRVRDAWFPDVSLFGDCFDADMTEPVGEAIGHLVVGEYDHATGAAVDALARSHGRAMPELELHLVLAECHARHDRVSPRALKNLRRAMERLGGIRAAITQPGDRPGAERLSRAIAAKAAMVAGVSSLPGEALWFIQEMKLQCLCDGFDGAAAIRPATADEYLSHLAGTFALEPDAPAPDRLFAALGDTPLDPETDREFDEPWSVGLERTVFDQQLAGRQAGRTAPVYAVEPADLDALWQRLEDGDVFVEYLLAADAAIAVVVANGEADVVHIPLDRPLTPLIADAWQALAAPPRTGTVDLDGDLLPLRLLGASLLSPIAHWLADASRLIVAPCGPLHRLPWGVLHDGQGWLAERVEIVQVPTAAVYTRLDIGRGPWDVEAAFVADPAGDRDGARAGTDALAAVCPGHQSVDGEPLGRDQAIDLVSAAALVHLSLPGYVDLDFPACSPICLNGTFADASSLLSPYMLQDASARPVVVVLDGLTVEPGRPGTETEVAHPAAGLHAGGASNVVATAWRADANATGALFAAFWEALQEESVPSALQTAQHAIRSQPATAHPHYWGAPICSGEGSASIAALREHGVI